MIVGVPKEIKTLERRVALTSDGAYELTQRGHTVLVQEGAGIGSGISDAEYIQAGARLVTADEAWGAEMVIKVKEPLPEEYKYFEPGKLLFTYLHLAAEEVLTRELVKSGITAVAYETVEPDNGSLPLLAPMSEVAGRMAVQVGVHFLEGPNGGSGVLLGGVPGVAPANVVVIGGGVVGINAIKMAFGLGAQVTVLDVDAERLRYLDDIYHGRLKTLHSTRSNIAKSVAAADLVVGAVLVTGDKAPCLVTRDMLAPMREGSVVVDIAIDQGGCIETIHATTHAKPTYVVDGVVHYGVANVPGAVPRTSTFALTNQTQKYAIALADQGLDALRADRTLRRGLNVHKGLLTYGPVARVFDMPFVAPEQALEI